MSLTNVFPQMSYGAEKIVKASDLVPDNDDPICVVVGAIAKGSRSHDLMRPIWTFGLSDQPTAVAEFFSGAINTQYSIFLVRVVLKYFSRILPLNRGNLS